MSSSLSQLFSKAYELVKVSEKHDRVLPIIFAFVPLIAVFSSYMILFVGFYVAFVFNPDIFVGVVVAFFALILFSVAFSLYITYVLIRRRNEHFRRSVEFFSAVSEISSALGFKRSASIRDRLRDLVSVSGSRRAVLNTVLSIIPFYSIYIYHFLNRDFHKHSEKELLILRELLDELREYAVSSQGHHTIPHQLFHEIETFGVVEKRSTALYTVATIFTFGIFAIYWLYTLINDPNKHFEKHTAVDKVVVHSLEAVARGRGLL